MKGLENAIRNLNSLDTRMVPQASAWAINRVAQKAVSVATRQVAGNTVAGDNQVKGIPLKLVRQRVRVFKASPSGKMTARIRVNRGNLPAIKLNTTRRRAGEGLRVGKYFFRGAFVQQLANGRWHVLRRLTGLTVAPASASVKVGATTTLTFTVKPDGASDKAISVHSSDPQTATVTLNGLVATVKGVKQGSVSIVGMTADGNFVAVAAVTVSAAG